MRIEKFQAFVAALKESQTFLNARMSHQAFRFSAGIWYDENGTRQTDESILAALQHTLKRGKHWRQRKSRGASALTEARFSYYPVPDLLAVVRVMTTSPTQVRTRDVTGQVVTECFQHANQSFDASHDDLTGLLSPRAINERALGAVSRSDGISRVALIMLDLDFFKQINDSHTHEYGDIVLGCFANRVQKALSRLHEGAPGQWRFDFGRPGGEEFLIVLEGEISESILEQVAESVRKTIEAEALPSDEEWQALPETVRTGGIELPSRQERRVTASLGISSIVSENKSEARVVLGRLKQETDAALFRAKTGGRNTVRGFSSIRTKYGTILKHHRETGVVVIDVGTFVGVVKGDEFRVYHPDFSGGKPFTFSDGRTTKRLGLYPRYQSGQIQVFDTQREISFCTVKEPAPEEFPAGATLELIQVANSERLSTPKSVDGDSVVDP